MCEFYEGEIRSNRSLYPIMITFGVISLITTMGLLVLVFCFLGRHRKEYLALYGKRTVVSNDESLIEEDFSEEPQFAEREPESPKMSPQQNQQDQEYSLGETDEELEDY